MQTLSLMEPVISTYKYRKNLQQERAVASRLGVEPSALANYRKGERRMPDTAIAELADGLNVELGDMIAVINIGLVRTEESEKTFWLSRIHNAQLKNLASQNFTPPTPPAPSKKTTREARQNQG